MEEIVNMIQENPFTIAQGMTIAVLVFKDLTVGFIRRKLDRKEIEVGAILERLEAVEKNEEDVSQSQKAMLAMTDSTMKMLNNLTQNAKLPTDAKKYSNELIVEAGLLIKDYGLDNIEQLTDTGRKKILDRIGNDNAQVIAETLYESATDLAVEAIPDSVRNFITPEE